MAIPISQLVSQVQVDLGTSEQTLRQHKQTLLDTANGSQQFGKATAEIGEKAVQLRARLIELSSELGGLRSRLRDLENNNSTLGGLLGPNIQQTRLEMGRVQEQMVSVRGELRELGRGATDSGSALSGLSGTARQTRESVSDLGTQVDRTGNSFSTGVGHVLRYAAAYEALRVAKGVVSDLAESAISLQTELVKTTALTDVSSASIGGYGREIVKLSTDVGKTGKELGEAFYFVASSGVAGADGMKVLEPTAKAAAAGLGETKKVADAVTSSLNAYKLPASQATMVTDTLVAAVKAGKGEASDFAGSLGRVLPVAAASGVSLQQVAASMAVMTRTGLSADEAATSLRGTLSELERPGTAAKKALEGIGLSADSVRASIRDRGLLTTLEDLYTRTGGNVEILGAIIPNVRALVGVLSTAGSQGEAYNQVLNDMNNAQGATQKAFEKTAEAVDFQSKRVRAAFEAIAGGAQDSLPMTAQFLGGLADGINKGTEFSTALQKTSDDAFSSWKKEIGDAIEMNTRFNDTLGPVPKKLDEVADGGQKSARGMGVLGEAMGAVLTNFLRPLVLELSAYVKLLELATDLGDRLAQKPHPHMNESEYNAQFGGDRAPVRDDYRLTSGPVPPGWDENFQQMYHVPTNTEQAQQIDYTQIRQQAQALAATSSEAKKLHETMADLWKLLADADPTVIETKLKSLAAAEAAQEQAWRRANDPEEGERRVSILQGLNDRYTQAYLHGTAEQVKAAQEATDAYLQQQGAADTAAQAEKHRDEQRRAAAAEAKRQQDADPLVGIRQGLSRDRDDLIGTAGTVMADLQSAISLKGQQGARAAGEAFSNEARKWGQDLQKAGVPGWKESFDQLIALGETAVVTGSPQVIAAIHELLSQGEREIRDSNIGKAMAEAMAKANAEMLTAQARSDDQLLRAELSAGDARAQALQGEVDREYDIWASREVDKLTDADRNNRELQRIREGWDREDVDRAETHRREQADRDSQATRAAQDRARDAARSIADLQENQARSQSDLGRSRAREDADALYEHTKRLKDIGTAGGPNQAKAITDENANYQQQIADRARKRQEDDAEASIRRAQQVSDVQKRQAEQAADAQRRSGEQVSDLSKRQGNQDADLVKARARQLQARTDQQSDSEWLKTQRIDHEKDFYVDAESKAKIKLQNDLSRIDARYDHEYDKAAATSDLIAAKYEHDQAEAAIKARARYGDITQDQATEELGGLDLNYTRQQTEIQSTLRGKDAATDQRLRDAVAGSRRYASGFTPGAGGGSQLSAADAMSLPDWQRMMPGGGAPNTQMESVRALWQAIQDRSGTLSPKKDDNPPIPVVVQNIEDLADAANDRPVQMDGEDVEDVQSKIRRNRNLSRAI